MSRIKQNTKQLLEELSNNLQRDNYHGSDYESIIFKLEQMSRKETNSNFIEIFSDEKLALKLVEIGDINKKNTLLISRILSLLGNMYRRYGLYISNKVWQFFLDCMHITKARYYVYLFLPIFPQFESYNRKWEFIMEMPNVAPTRSSLDNFYALIKSYLNDEILIPKEFKDRIISQFENILLSKKIGINIKNNIENLITELEKE